MVEIHDIHGMNINALDLNLLRVFHVMLEERSVTRASEQLGLSQPAVSNALKRLRLAFDDDLFVRGKGGMVVTPRAEELSIPIAEAMQQIEIALIGGANVDPARIKEPITITCADEEILLHGSAILDALECAGCRAPVQFLPLDTRYRTDMLWRSRLAVTITTILFAPEGLKQRKIYDDYLVCLMRSDHPAAKQLDLEAYIAAEHLLVAPLGGSPFGYLDDWLRKKGLARTIRLITHSFGSAHSLVEETGLLATIPSREAARQDRLGNLTVADLPIDAPSFGVHIFWSERYDNDPVNKWLRDTIHQAMTRPDVKSSRNSE